MKSTRPRTANSRYFVRKVTEAPSSLGRRSQVLVETPALRWWRSPRNPKGLFVHEDRDHSWVLVRMRLKHPRQYGVPYWPVELAHPTGCTSFRAPSHGAVVFP